MTEDEYISVEKFISKLEAEEEATDMKHSLYRLPQWMMAKEVNDNNTTYEGIAYGN